MLLALGKLSAISKQELKNIDTTSKNMKVATPLLVGTAKHMITILIGWSHKFYTASVN